MGLALKLVDDLPEVAGLRKAVADLAADFPDGVPGVRSVEYPCAFFDGKEADGGGDCCGDGHYLCLDCSRMARSSPHWPEGK